MIPAEELTEAVNENLSEMRNGIRGISSKFRLVCTHCGNLIDRGLSVGDPCPLNKGHCSGTLVENPRYQA